MEDLRNAKLWRALLVQFIGTMVLIAIGCDACLRQSSTVVDKKGVQCQKLDGVWRSATGSQLKLSHSEDRVLHGRYLPVGGEFGIDSEANTQSYLTGAAAYNQTDAVFSLSVMGKNGASIKAWIGQCLMNGNDEQLETSWMLSQRADDCSDKWLTTSIGKMVFKRELNDNAQKNLENNQQKQISNRKATSGPRKPCSLEGKWYNGLGSQMFIEYHQNATIRGWYGTAVERSIGSAGTGPSKVYGMANELDTRTAIALYVVWKNGGSVTGWVGQCQICGENQTEIIKTTWLLREKVDSYKENWRATYIGYDDFTRDQQTPGIPIYEQSPGKN